MDQRRNDELRRRCAALPNLFTRELRRGMWRGRLASSPLFPRPWPRRRAPNYLLSFDLNNPGGNSPNQLLVSWNGSTVWGVTNFAAPGWTNVQVPVTGGGTSAALQLAFEADMYFGLDDVSVELGGASAALHSEHRLFARPSRAWTWRSPHTAGNRAGIYCVPTSTNLCAAL